MEWARQWRTPLPVALLFTLLAGEAIRNALGWGGFTTWALLALAAMAALLIRAPAGHVHALFTTGRVQDRSPRRGSPFALGAAFVVWAVASLAWSDYRGATVLAAVVLAATTLAGVTLFAALGWPGLLQLLSNALLAILGLSLLFEFAVAAVIRRPILPTFPINVEPGERIPQAFYWSRALLFEGGRIQGILGNANLLGFIALLALIVVGCQWAAGQVGRVYGVAGVALSVLTLGLTRSSTVIVCTVAVAVVLLLMLFTRRRLWVALWSLVGVLVAGAVGAVAAYPLLLGLLGKSEDLTGRLDIWSAVWGLFVERPILGWGWTSYWQPWVPLFQDLAVRNGVVYLQAHNAYLDVAFQLGIVGLALFLGFIVATCVAVGRRGIPVDVDEVRAQRERGDRVWRRVGWFRDAASGRSSTTGDSSGGSPAAASSLTGIRRGVSDETVRWVLGKVLPALLLTALLTQALAESRLLVEGNWALLVIIALAASGPDIGAKGGRKTPRTGVVTP